MTGRRTNSNGSADHLASRLARALVVAVAVAVWILLQSARALALEPVAIAPDQDRVEITPHAQFLDRRGDSIQVETAPGADGMAGRMSVRASAAGINPTWLVFALRNNSDRPIERWLTAERYNPIGSGIIWPDLDAKRIEAVTPSIGFLPDRVASERADLFRITLEPGQTVTYAAELASDRFARVYVWKPLAYELHVRDRQLFNGIMLGITGVLGIFLTAVFAANHKLIFPSAALVTWCVLAYLCVDFGLWHKLFQLPADGNSLYRSATEAAMAASLLIFLYIFLRLTGSNGIARMLLSVWMIAQLSLIAVAIIDARLASTFARASFAVIGCFGITATCYLALRGQDRALALLPTWILLLVWIFAATVTLTGRLSGEAVVSSLSGGLVLITVLIGFTVTQFAFRSYEPLYGASPNEQQIRSLAIDGSGSALWEWNARRDEIKTGPMIEATLGLNPGELSRTVDDFCAHLHPADRERFRLLLWSVKERGGGEVRTEIRMLHADNSYRWFDLEAGAVPSPELRVLRFVGLMREITESKRVQERLLHDAVHDSLTGLPNRELFLDRLGIAIARAKREPTVAPAVLLIDFDKFKSVNASFGLIVGDSLLLTLARRMQHHVGPMDTLARLGGNQFVLSILKAPDPAELTQLAETLRVSIRSPIKLAGQDIVLTAAIGIAMFDRSINTAEELLKEAEIAMYRAKRGGADRVELFRPEMRGEVDDRITIESGLRQAIDRKQLMVLYQPIVSLATEELAGFEALVRWQHPKLGLLNPVKFVPLAEKSDLIVQIGSYVINEAIEDAANWQRILPRAERPLFVSVNVSSRELFHQDLLQEIRRAVGRSVLPTGCLRLEITESLVMENPERAVEVLEWLRSAGAGLSLDDFGSGYSSLSYLQRFPFDTIKIDRDLVQASGSDENGSTIVRSIIALVHELGKKVVAEGVEVRTDVGFLRSIGCEYAQGFYYGEPIPQREVERMLQQIRKSENRLQYTGFFRTTTKHKEEQRARRKKRPHPSAQAVGDAETASTAANPAAGAGPGANAQAAKSSLRAARGMRTRVRNAGSRPPADAGESNQAQPPQPRAPASSGALPPTPAPQQPAAAQAVPVSGPGATRPAGTQPIIQAASDVGGLSNRPPPLYVPPPLPPAHGGPASVPPPLSPTPGAAASVNPNQAGQPAGRSPGPGAAPAGPAVAMPAAPPQQTAARPPVSPAHAVDTIAEAMQQPSLDRPGNNAPTPPEPQVGRGQPLGPPPQSGQSVSALPASRPRPTLTDLSTLPPDIAASLSRLSREGAAPEAETPPPPATPSVNSKETAD